MELQEQRAVKNSVWWGFSSWLPNSPLLPGLFSVHVCREKKRDLCISLPLHMKTPALSDQGPTLVTSCILSHFSCVQLFVTLWTVTHSLLCPWDSPGKNTGLGGHSLLQGIFLTQGLNPGLPHSFNLNYFPKGPISKHSHTENQDLNILIEKEGGTQFSPKQIPKASSDNAGTPWQVHTFLP